MNTTYSKYKELVERTIVIAEDETLALYSEFKITAPVNFDTVNAALLNPTFGEKFKKRFFQVAKVAEARDNKAFAMNSGINSDGISFEVPNMGFNADFGPQIAPTAPAETTTTAQPKKSGFTWEVFNNLVSNGTQLYATIKDAAGKSAPSLQRTNTQIAPTAPEKQGFDFSFKNPVVITLVVVIVVAAAIYWVKSRKNKR